MKSVLKGKGYLVFIAHDAQEAGILLDHTMHRFDLIITDLDLGSGANGLNIACKARETDADIPIIYLTGTPINEWRIDAPKSLLMQKPVTAEGVAKAVLMFNERLVEKHKSCLSNIRERLQFRISYLKQCNRRLVQAAADEAVVYASNLA